MKTIVKTFLGIAAFFGCFAGWHAVAPREWCWLDSAQIAACIVLTIAFPLIAIPFYFDEI